MNCMGYFTYVMSSVEQNSSYSDYFNIFNRNIRDKYSIEILEKIIQNMQKHLHNINSYFIACFGGFFLVAQYLSTAH